MKKATTSNMKNAKKESSAPSKVKRRPSLQNKKMKYLILTADIRFVPTINKNANCTSIEIDFTKG